MDRYNPAYPYPYNYGYGYPPPSNQPYPPPGHPPPQQSQPYPYPQPSYPYAPQPYNYPYGQPPPQFSPSPSFDRQHSGAHPYPHNPYPPSSAPPPHSSLQHGDSFRYGSPSPSFHEHSQYPPSAPGGQYPPIQPSAPGGQYNQYPPTSAPGGQYPQYPPPGTGSQYPQYPPSQPGSELHSRANSFSDSHVRDDLAQPPHSDASAKPSAYPPVDALVAKMSLSDKPEGGAPASPPAPSVQPVSYYPPSHPTLSSSTSSKLDYPPAHPTFSSSASSKLDYPPSYPTISPSASSKLDYPPSHPTLSSSASSKLDYRSDNYGSDAYGNPLATPYARVGASAVANLTHSYSFAGSHESHGPGRSHSRSHSLSIVPSVKGSLKVLLLHGNLDIWIYDAKCLPNMDMFHKTMGEVFGFSGKQSNKVDGNLSRKVTSDPYVSISIAGAVIGRTYVLSNEENPVWMQHFNVPVAHSAAEVHFLVKDSDVVGSQLIGLVSIPVDQIYGGDLVKGTYPILNTNGKPCKPGAVLSLSIQYMPIEDLTMYHHGVGAGPDYGGCPGTYFPLRKGGSITLYQDAHVVDGTLPNTFLDSGVPYVHGKCWQDIFDAIRQARRLVYITGWSVWHDVRLVRDGGAASSCTLGELLRSKSQEGVRILLLVWDDPTSRSILGFKSDGLMQTHDEETRRFFKHSSVQVLLCPRIAGKRHSWVKQREVETIYTHHQKTVIVDADAGNNNRKIIAFVGGLDLCDGRYDSSQHPLFRTLETVHKDDYHNPSFSGSTNGCPREPWHDLHSKIDGPAAYDVLTNFQDRWLKAAKPHGIKKLQKSYDDALLNIDRMTDIVGLVDAPFVSEHDPEGWHVQIFRSIDSNSVKGFPKNPKEATSKNLVCGKNVLIDMSIHSAYVKAIRSAQHYIYIENQYFIGSSYNWSSHKDIGANNLIPMEIALKVAEKIKAHERFGVYIVIPMWPEGVPTGNATQRILYWQNKTMQMMYETIYKALVEVGLEDAYTPQDYLNFFCLGNREALYGGHSSSASHAPNTPQAHCQKSRRFMIYVHSKGMIVDDEYVIVGSANINQRSLEGTRDTEIAMGAYQPNYTWARKGAHPRGQVFGYRMSLWAEHTGTVEDCFNEPESIECVRRVKSMGEMNWKQFAAEEATDMRGHLMKYPVEVDRRGKVRPIPGSETFPDFGGNICGSFLAIQENLTI